MELCINTINRQKFTFYLLGIFKTCLDVVKMNILNWRKVDFDDCSYLCKSFIY
ncbi:hypothetical protein THERMOT_670 [Bathymodiolus thermophilus thioautotrophic gill symbiont]|nr:hypothetical protein THERMOT_670 [Bathymodiolus thermophilus thioautotrophic gill symbiont]